MVSARQIERPQRVERDVHLVLHYICTPLTHTVISASYEMAQNFDRRRINGPEESFSPVFEEDIVPEPGTSRAGRGPLDIRPICMHDDLLKLCVCNDFFLVLKPGLISQANGSAYIETEKTKIACAV